MNQFAECGFSLYETVRDFQFAAEIGQPDDQFDGIDVISNNN